MKNKQAILFLCHDLNQETLRRFDSLDQPSGFDKWLLYDTAKTSPRKFEINNRRYFGFSYENLIANGFLPIRKKLVPGSNHFPVLTFAHEHSGYSHIWLVEYDVIYTGNWSEFLQSFANDVDFLSIRIMNCEEKPKWYWWNSFRPSKRRGEVTRERKWSSFNPLYRLSKSAATHLRNEYLSGCRGHHEVTMATVLIEDGFHVEEIGGQGSRTPDVRKGKYYDKNTFRWRPCINLAKKRDNCLYHPVK